MEARIRKYKEDDKERLRFICRETAGEYFRKSSRMLDAVPIIYSDYFTENEPENIFVIADENDTAAGYIICSSDVRNFRKKMLRVYIPRAVKASVRMLPACVGYFGAHIVSGKKNGVHLHIDILPGFQHKGYGTKLIDALRAHLHSLGVPILCVNTIDRGEPAYKFYKKYGFSENKHYVGDIYSLSIPTETEDSE